MEFQSFFLSSIILFQSCISLSHDISLTDIILLQIISLFIGMYIVIKTLSNIEVPLNENEFIYRNVDNIFVYTTNVYVILSNIIIYLPNQIN
jgi:hypothetical protein